MFNESLEKWFPVLEVGKVYEITGATIKPIGSNKKYTSINHKVYFFSCHVSG